MIKANINEATMRNMTNEEFVSFLYTLEIEDPLVWELLRRMDRIMSGERPSNRPTYGGATYGGSR